VVRVRDTGIGIDPEALPQVFELFAQVQRSLERAEGGLGVGLSLVRQLVEMHGGSVEAISAGPGRGSEFVVRLPLTADQHTVPAPAAKVGEGRASTAVRRILVADDNADSADALSLMLRVLGHEVHTRYDGQEALEAVRAERVEVALLDIGMPRLDGYEVARRIRQEPWGRHLKLVAMTGWGQTEDRQRAQAAGFDVHITKPVEPATLLACLAKF
jgi:CheY-like chemotaxis protein